jgi:hypothetical protein
MTEIGQQAKSRRNEASEVVERKVEILNSSGIEEVRGKGASESVVGKRESGQRGIRSSKEGRRNGTPETIVGKVERCQEVEVAQLRWD